MKLITRLGKLFLGLVLVVIWYAFASWLWSSNGFPIKGDWSVTIRDMGIIGVLSLFAGLYIANSQPPWMSRFWCRVCIFAPPYFFLHDLFLFARFLFKLVVWSKVDFPPRSRSR